MIACLDVHYYEQRACAAAVVFDEFRKETPTAEYLTMVKCGGDYEPGYFYRRELSPLLAVIDRIKEPIQIFIIDAYCYLSADNSHGLGAHLYDAIHQHASIIGVAKNRYQDSTHAKEVFRSGSNRPLFITSLGLSRKVAASKIATMAGPYRIPTMLKKVDQLARAGIREVGAST